MSDFPTMDTQAAADILEQIGQTATYTPSGATGVSLNAILFEDRDPFPSLGGQAHVSERTIEILVGRDDLSADPEIGDAITIGSTTYSVADYEDDGTVWRLRCDE